MNDHAHELHDEHGHEGVGHVVPLKILFGVWAALMVLTVLTVAVTYVDLGASVNIFVAMLIAVAKAGLVALYFMHLRWDSPLNGVVLIIALLFVAVFIGIALLDTIEYQPAFEVPSGMTIRP
jgi:cytochrome c oxidase subunit 4